MPAELKIRFAPAPLVAWDGCALLAWLDEVEQIIWISPECDPYDAALAAADLMAEALEMICPLSGCGPDYRAEP